MKEFYTPFVYLAAGMVAIAAAIRLTWELLEPALVPVTIILVLVTLAIIGLRYLWHHTSL